MAISWRRVANYLCFFFDFFSRESPDLPHEIIEEIFIRIPVKSLLRFRCVSKSCRGMIDSRDFINKHLKHSSETRTRRHFFMQSSGGRKFKIYEVSLDISHNNGMSNSWIVNHNVFGILGSCNGLLLLVISGRNLVLWNPSTRKYQNIPECHKQYSESVGFGYDNIDDDYKIVKLTKQSPPNDDNTLVRYAVRIYSLKTTTWKTLPSFIHGRCIRLGRGAYASGYVHWLASDQGSSKVQELLAFNLAREEFKVLSLPKDGELRNLTVIGGRLCVVSACNARYIYSGRPIQITLSVLNSNYADGVETWKKLWSIEVSSLPYQTRLIMPIVHSNTCTKLLLKVSCQQTPYILYDLQVKKCLILGSQHEDIGNPDICFESLVVLDKDDSNSHFNIVMCRKQPRQCLKDPTFIF